MSHVKYVYGGNGLSWPGYCEYDTTLEQYRYYPDPNRTTSLGWIGLPAQDLQGYVRRGLWKPADGFHVASYRAGHVCCDSWGFPEDLRLPEGF